MRRPRPAGSNRGPTTPPGTRAGPRRPRIAGAGPALALVIAAGLALLVWTTRHALHGVPVADDYDFLARARLSPPVDPFDSGGFPYYWRPLTRQAYYATLGDTLLAAPWLAALLHGAALALLAFLLHRIARRSLPPREALCFAALPLVAESARLLLAWPACGQPLFGATFAAAAVAAALAGRTLLAAGALLAGLLSYEQAGWAAPIVVAALLRGSTGLAERTRRLAPVAVAFGAWLAGMVVARGHGVRWPVPALPGDPAPVITQVLAVVANVDLLAPGPRGLLLAAQLLLVLLAVLAARTRRDRGTTRRGARTVPSGRVLAACAVLGLLALAPAFLAAELWAPRHAFLPLLLLGYAVIGLFARAGGGFAPAWLALRGAALLLAPVASTTVLERPLGDARTSFPELVRLQRIVDSARRALLSSPECAKAGGASYWALPLRSTVAFAGEKAPRVWTANPAFHWAWFERPERSPGQRHYPVLAFDIDVADPACVVDATVVEDYFTAAGASMSGNSARIDSILAAASARNGPRPGPVLDELERLRAGMAAMRGEFALAESLVAVSAARYGTKADHVAISGWIALGRGRPDEARRLAATCLAHEPRHPMGSALLAVLEARNAGQE